MTITLYNPDPTSDPIRFGPGMTMYGAVSGPNPSSWGILGLFTHGSGLSLWYWSAWSGPLGGANTWQLDFVSPPVNDFAEAISPPFHNGFFRGLADNTGITLALHLLDSQFGTSQDSVGFSGKFFWDPLSGMLGVNGVTGIVDTKLDAILAAVYRPFPPS
jgi:hypothetical protein